MAFVVFVTREQEFGHGGYLTLEILLILFIFNGSKTHVWNVVFFGFEIVVYARAAGGKVGFIPYSRKFVAGFKSRKQGIFLDGPNRILFRSKIGLLNY